MGRTKSRTKGRNAPKGFAGIPRHVMEHPDYKKLSGNAVKLLILMAFQYRGKNNGDLTGAWGFAKKHGFNSQATLSRATHELLDACLLIRTREGVFLNPGGRCALYAVTWVSIDDCMGKNLEVKATIRPPRQFSIENSRIKMPASETVSTGYRN